MNKNFPDAIITLKGLRPGASSMILVGVHGNETCGVDALNILMPKLKIQAGTVYIAYGNPKALSLNKRFFETNLNRMFFDDEYISDLDKTTYEYSRAKEIKKYLNQVDALLDIHASNSPDSTPFIICEPNSKNITDSLPAKTIVYGFDSIQPGGTDYYMNKIGKIGICIECGYTQDVESIETAKESILAFLGKQGHIGLKPTSMPQNQFQIYEQYINTTQNFKLIKEFKDFEFIKAGQTIGFDGSNEVKSKKDSFILFARNRTEANQEAFLLAEEI